jgi:hypothetical protein
MIESAHSALGRLVSGACGNGAVVSLLAPRRASYTGPRFSLSILASPTTADPMPMAPPGAAATSAALLRSSAPAFAVRCVNLGASRCSTSTSCCCIHGQLSYDFWYASATATNLSQLLQLLMLSILMTGQPRPWRAAAISITPAATNLSGAAQSVAAVSAVLRAIRAGRPAAAAAISTPATTTASAVAAGCEFYYAS